MTALVSGLHEVFVDHRPYKGLVVDLWGVMHNGKALFPPAIAALEFARAQGLSITLLSNAPRRKQAALEGLGRLGLSSELFDDLITSGEIAWQALKNGQVAPAWGTRVHLLGAGKDLPIRDGLDTLTFVDDVLQADWILNVGPEAGHEDTSAFQAYLEKARDQALPMMCANPDLVVRRGAFFEICAGAIAHDYRALGGEVHWFGKPYGQVYAAVYASCGLSAQDLLAVGDSFKTDVRGACQQGMDVLFVGTGIHGHEVGQPLNMTKVVEIGRSLDAIPTYATDQFSA